MTEPPVLACFGCRSARGGITKVSKKETGINEEMAATAVIKKALDYNLEITGKVNNPFGYARQSFLYKDKVIDGFFIPHDNETGLVVAG
jgi:hypothetical protein